MSIDVISRWFGNVIAGRFAPVIAYTVLILSSVALLPDLNGGAQGDVQLYENVSQDLVAGKLPYRDRVLEYPPYVIPIILLPHIFENDAFTYSMGFKYQTLFVDWLLKLLLFMIGLRQLDKSRSFLPLLCYCLAIPFLHFFFLQRYDVWPALICTLGIWLFCSGRHTLAGVCFAVGVGVKVYPIVFVPPLFLLASRQGNGRQFFSGIVAGLMPMVMLSFALPWWRFAEFQGARGLQCESLYASIIWFANHLGLTQAKWIYTKAWFEVQGPLAEFIVPWARLLFTSAVMFSVAYSTWVAACCEKLSIGHLARLLLVPLLGFVAFNQVLSPQFMVWLLPVAALGLLEGKITPIILLTVATMVTHIIFPSFNGDYSNGLNLWETIVLLLRNLTLIIAWALLVREMFPSVRHAGWAPVLEIRKSLLALFRRSSEGHRLVTNYSESQSVPLTSVRQSWKMVYCMLRRPFFVLLAFKCIYFAILVSAILLFPINQDANIFHSKRQAWTTDGHLTFDSHFTAWDSEHYLHISEGGYQAGTGLCAFYPLWPMAVRYFSPFVGGSDVLGGVILANIVSLIGVYMFFNLVRRRLGESVAWLSLILLIAFPGSLFFQFNYTEGLFLMLLMLLCVGVEKGKAALALVTGFLLPLTKGVGIFCVLPLFLYLVNHYCYLRNLRSSQSAKRSRVQRFLQRILLLRSDKIELRNWVAHQHLGTTFGLVLAPFLGWLLYLALMWKWTGNPLEGFDAQRDWGVQSVGNLFDIPKFVIGFFTPTTWHEFSGSTLDRCIFFVCVIMLPLIWKLSRIWFMWTLVLAVVPAMSGTFVSFTRFASVAFPVFIALAVFLLKPERRILCRLTIGVFFILHIVLLWRFVNYSWAG